ncbi:MAG: hypothetical protein ACYC9L_03165 [Sulfuricaulis sp.]
MAIFQRRVALAVVSILWCAIAFGQAAPVQPAQPRQDWQNSYETTNGSYMGDGELSKLPTLNYAGDQSNPTDWDSIWMTDSQGRSTQVPVNQIVPHADSVYSFDTKVQAAGTHASDLHALRDLTTTETARMAKDTGTMGQAMAITNNSALAAGSAKSTAAGTGNLAGSVGSLQNAGNNALLQQTFSGCSQSIQQGSDGTSGGNLLQTKACSFVQLKFTPGFAAHVYRTVSVSFPNEYGIHDNTNEVLNFGATDTWQGVLPTVFPAADTTLTSFNVYFYRINNGPLPSEYSATIITTPSKANGWNYKLTISREAQPNPVPSYDTPGAAIFVRMEWTYNGDPVYTFSKPICDKGDCSITGDEFCKATWTCNSKAPVMSSNGYLVPLSAFTPTTPGPLYQLIQQLDPNYTTDMQTDEICMDATLNIDCSGIYSGSYCVPGATPTSPPVCSSVPSSTTLPNDCPQIQADPTCHQSGQVCADNGQSQWDGYCYVMTELFTCYVPDTADNGNVSTVTTCPGNQPCMDGSCTTYDKKQNVGYSRTRALGQQVIAQHFLSDWETKDEYANDPLNLTNDGNATPGNAATGGTGAAAMADYKRLLEAQKRMLSQHPEMARKVLDAAKKAQESTTHTQPATEGKP